MSEWARRRFRTGRGGEIEQVSEEPGVEAAQRAGAGALRRLDAWLAGRSLDDAALATYLAARHDAWHRGALPVGRLRGP